MDELARAEILRLEACQAAAQARLNALESALQALALDPARNGGNLRPQPFSQFDYPVKGPYAIEEPERAKGFLFRQGSATGGVCLPGYVAVGTAITAVAQYTVAVTTAATHFWLVVKLADATVAWASGTDFPASVSAGYVGVPVLSFVLDGDDEILRWTQHKSGVIDLNGDGTGAPISFMFNAKTANLKFTLHAGMAFLAGVRAALNDTAAIENNWEFDFAGSSDGDWILYLEIDLTTGASTAFEWNKRQCNPWDLDGDDDTEYWPILQVTIASGVITTWKNLWVGDIHITRTA